MTHRILLYYKFVKIDNPVTFCGEHLELCRSLGLLGRIIIAREGINGTVSGTVESTEAYKSAIWSDARFADLAFKENAHEGHAFPKLSVKARAEIVTIGQELLDQPTGKHLPPDEFLRILESENVIVIDGRNDYEYDLGHFEGAIRPNFEVFKDYPSWLEANLGDKKDKKILTYCTGGIRCEKLTAIMIDQGFQDVNQLQGGIVEYGKDPKTRGSRFHGQCFVFDSRIAVPINSTENQVVVGRCFHCNSHSESYVNCANVECNKLYLCCEGCPRCCSVACQEAPRKREAGRKMVAQS